MSIVLTKRDNENAEKKLGLKDIPIQSLEDEKLGLERYAKALCSFVKDCETPMTVSLQGDWGSGKTSLMNILREDLIKQKIPTIWFNTWQYSQFELADQLPFLLISRIVSEVNDSGMSKFFEGFSNVVGTVGKAAFITAGSLAGHAEAAKETAAALSKDPKSTFDLACLITQIKDKLEKSIKNKLLKEKASKMVVFIDDLDRLRPVRAVELLEAMKLFLDIEQCVFIIAVDYHVVIQGLKEKFGAGEAELKGKSFFDKIIQVPFNMPVEKYQVDDYIKSLLDKTLIKYNSEDIEIYRQLIEASIGFNPRSLKRLFNSLLLLKLMEEQGQDNGDDIIKVDRMRILFSILCMQLKYPYLYYFFNSLDLTPELLEKFNQDEWSEDEFSQPLLKIIHQDERIAISNLQSDSQRNEFIKSLLEKCENFMKVFFRAIQLSAEKDKERVSENELKNIESILKLSRVVASERDKNGINNAAKLTKEGFLESLTPADHEYYKTLFEFLEEHEMPYEMGQKGFTVRGGRENKTIVVCYPSQGSGKTKNSISMKNIPAGKKRKAVQDFLLIHGFANEVEKDRPFPFKLKDFPVEQLCELLKIFLPKGNNC